MNYSPTNVRNKDNRETSDNVRRVLSNYTQSKTYWDRGFQEEIENWRFYYAKNPELGLGQYKLDVALRLQEQGRQLLQYNLCKPTVDALAGSLMQMRIDPSYVPINSEVTSLTEAVQKALYSDKEQLNWGSALLGLTVGGLVHQGVIKMFVSDRFSDLGNIGIECCLPGTVFPDPAWKTAVSSDCKMVHEELWLTPEEMIAMFPKEADRIQFWATAQKLRGSSYGLNTGVTPYKGLGSNDVIWGNKYRVIGEHRVLDEIKPVTCLMKRDCDVEIPDDIPEGDIPQYLDATHGSDGWRAEDVYVRDRKERRNWVEYVCESLVSETALFHGETEVQCGATPFKFWSASMHNGEPLGIISSIKDAQQNVNYWEMMIVDKLQTEGGGGAQFSDPEMFKSRLEFDKYVKERNNKRLVFELAPGIIERGVSPAIPVQKSSFPQEAYSHLNHIIEMIWPRISKTTPSTMGRAESGSMPNKLFENLKVQTDNASWTINFGIRQFYNDLYEGYFYQFVETYSNEQIERVFMVKGGREKIKINEHVTLDDGSEAIRNDVAELKKMRHYVIIAEKPESPTEQMQNVQTYAALIESFAKLPSAGTSINYFKNQIIKNLPQFTEEEREIAQSIADKELELDMLMLEAKVNEAYIAKLQSEQKVQAAESQMGSGVPVGSVQPQPGMAGQQQLQEPPSVDLSRPLDPQIQEVPQIPTNVPQAQGAING